jgi:DNA-binding GntR family transcriptional regulator
MKPDESGTAAGLKGLIDGSSPRFRTASEYVEATLRAAILSGRLAGGLALRQEELADTFGVSRMPVREALRQLEAQALVDFVPHHGAVVTEISADDAADNYAIRLALEPMALRLSIPHLGGDDFSLAGDLIAEMDEETDAGRMGELNRRFHLSLYGRAGRAKLLQLAEQQLAAADRYLRFHLAAKGREHMSQQDHRAMLAAARERDIAGAVAVLEGHLRTAAQTIAAFFAARD